MLQLPKFSMGVGDRFGRQGLAQLAAFIKARDAGIDVTPVWNKSHREHIITGTLPPSVRDEADAAVRELGWDGPYFVDADHIRYDTVDEYIACSDFFTIDVADKIGEPGEIGEFADVINALDMIAANFSGIGFDIDEAKQITATYAPAVREAKRIYDRIVSLRGSDDFVVEISMDETESAQTPSELLLILVLIDRAGVPIQTIAPKFPGRFNKGIDFVGDIPAFAKAFEDMVAYVQAAAETFGLPRNLKLSVHTGSDKFSIYPIMRAVLLANDVGVHLKTAGTTWLEELAGLAEPGGDGLAMANEIYRRAYDSREALCGPYAAVIDIDPSKLPAPGAVKEFDGPAFAAMVRHDPRCGAYNPHARQLLHLGFKIAAELGDEFKAALDANAGTIAKHVTDNLLERHMKPLFGGTHESLISR